ncbi:MAG TPA: amidohydrolase family protein [Nevskiaceae bacterium]|nr:amidohydrolase family protein [Nevskiaceae bacterium]
MMADLNGGSRAWSLISVLVLCGGLTACASATPPQRADFAIRNVHVVDTRTGAVLPDRTIFIDGQRITAVTDGTTGQTALTEIDGLGGYAIPGLWDAHVHLLGDDADAALRVARVWLSFGVTHLRDMGSSAAALNSFRKAAPPDLSPALLASGPTLWTFELPYGDKAQQRIVRDIPEIRAAVDEAVASGADFIKVYAGFDADRLAALTKAAERSGLRVAGHAQSDIPLDVQASLGLRTVEHFEASTFQGCGVDPDPYFERIIGARFRASGETIPDILNAFVADLDRDTCLAAFRRAAGAGLAITPTLMGSFLPPSMARTLAASLSGDQREGCSGYLVGFGDDEAKADALYSSARNALMRLVLDSGMPILAGTDTPAFCSPAGSSLSSELALLSQSGLSPLAVLQAATLTPARVFGLSERFGHIEAGMDADIVVLPTNPLSDVTAYADPDGVFWQGRWRDKAELRRLRTAELD